MPNVVSGSVLNVLTGYLISRVKVRTLAVASALAAVVAPVLMATIDVGDNNYWFAPFWSMLLSPMSADGRMSTLYPLPCLWHACPEDTLTSFIPQFCSPSPTWSSQMPFLPRSNLSQEESSTRSPSSATLSAWPLVQRLRRQSQSIRTTRIPRMLLWRATELPSGPYLRALVLLCSLRSLASEKEVLLARNMNDGSPWCAPVERMSKVVRWRCHFSLRARRLKGRHVSPVLGVK